MTKNRATILGFLVFAVLLFSANSWAQQRDPIIEKVANAYGLDSYDKIEAIRYTWNIDIPGLFKASHKWEWEPKTGKILFESTDKDGKPVKVAYDSSQLASQPDAVKNEVEPAFVNDNYWLLFPFHAYWDKSATITNEGTKKLPIGAGSATLVTVKYPKEAGGYTPGDTWDLYVGKRLPSPGNGVSPWREQRRPSWSPHRGRATRRQVLWLFQPNTAATLTASPCTYG